MWLADRFSFVRRSLKKSFGGFFLDCVFENFFSTLDSVEASVIMVKEAKGGVEGRTGR